MNVLWQLLGRIAYIICWPLLWFYLHGSRRTRVIVVYEGKILLVKQWLGDGRWCLPGGGRHRRETAMAGAVRELREETGIEIDETQLVSLGDNLYSSQGLSFMFDLFMVQLTTPPQVLKRPLELVDVRWFAAEELLTEDLSSDVKIGLQHWSA